MGILKVKKLVAKYLRNPVTMFPIRIYKSLSWKKEENRIFCISTQRTGTTSVGDFFRHFGYPVARWRDSHCNSWVKSYYEGDYESIFSSVDFKVNQVFEDSPWWFPDFYKILYHRFPGSKFILFTRNSDSWIKSMISHSNGRNLDNTKVHCKLYRREKEYFDRIDNDPDFKPKNYKVDNLLELKGHEEQYKEIYEIRNREILEFFKEKSPNNFFVCTLEDKDKWTKLGKFMGIDVPEGFNVHSNKSRKAVS